MSRPSRPERTAWRYLLFLALYALLVAGYVGVRFAWGWQDDDAARLTRHSQNVYLEATAQPSSGAYPFGYAYPALNTVLSHVTGLPIAMMQTYVQPFLIVLLVPVAYAAFRSLTGERATALLASLLLFLQPEFLFESMRSSHAKVTWLLALTMLFVLARSLREQHGGWALGRWVFLFYLAAFALIASSSFFASSYLFGVAFAFAGGWVLARWRGEQWPSSRLARLTYVALSCSILLFLSLFYLYRPSLLQLRELGNAAAQVATLVLGADATNPYGYVASAWRAPWLYPVLTLLNWLVLGISFLAWLLKGRALLRRDRLPPHLLLLWLLYTAFALLLAISILLDLSGVLSANLQVRLFPHFMILAIPMASQILARGAHRFSRQGPWPRRAAVAALLVGMLFLSGASLLKATSEPLLNNHWWFHSSEEMQAASWAGEHLLDTTIWVGLGRRLSSITAEQDNWKEHDLWAVTGELQDYADNFLISESMAAAAARQQVALPDLFPHLRVYDSGPVQLHHVRPQTPYQR